MSNVRVNISMIAIGFLFILLVFALMMLGATILDIVGSLINTTPLIVIGLLIYLFRYLNYGEYS